MKRRSTTGLKLLAAATTVTAASTYYYYNTNSTTTGPSSSYLDWKNQLSFYADSDDDASSSKKKVDDPNTKSKEIEKKISAKLAKQRLAAPTRKILYVSPDHKWTLFGTKDTLRLVTDDITGIFKKRGYGWSGCAASQTANHFWMVADSEKKFLFKINFKTGTVSRIALDKSAKVTDMEAVTAVPQPSVDDPRFEELFLVASSSVNKTNTPKTERCRISFVKIPVSACHNESYNQNRATKSKENNNKDSKDSKDSKSSSSSSSDKKESASSSSTDKKDSSAEDKFEQFKEGESQFTLDDVRHQILDLITSKYSHLVTLDERLIAKEGGLDIEGACFFPAASKFEPHKLYLGLRGPQSNSHQALILSLLIPRVNGKTNPSSWQLDEKIHFVDLKGFSIRDMCLSIDQKSVYLLAGSLGQDKMNEDIREYPVYKWVPQGNAKGSVASSGSSEEGGQSENIRVIGAVPRFKSGDLQHLGLEASAWEEYGLKEKDIKIEEEADGWSSPEGLDVYRNKYGEERVLAVWDNNDVGCYSEIGMKDFRRETEEDRVEESGVPGGRREREKGDRRGKEGRKERERRERERNRRDRDRQ